MKIIKTTDPEFEKDLEKVLNRGGFAPPRPEPDIIVTVRCICGNILQIKSSQTQNTIDIISKPCGKCY